MTVTPHTTARRTVLEAAAALPALIAPALADDPDASICRLGEQLRRGIIVEEKLLAAYRRHGAPLDTTQDAIQAEREAGDIDYDTFLARMWETEKTSKHAKARPQGDQWDAVVRECFQTADLLLASEPSTIRGLGYIALAWAYKSQDRTDDDYRCMESTAQAGGFELPPGPAEEARAEIERVEAIEAEPEKEEASAGAA